MRRTAPSRETPSTTPSDTPADVPQPSPDRYHAVRATTEWLAEPLSPEDCAAQSMPDASPVKWHLAHTTWFFETMVLDSALADYTPFRPEFRVLFNSYYNSVGEQHPRPRRGLLTRPPLDEVRRYRRQVDRELLPLLEQPRRLTPSLRRVVEIGLHHEQQHQELILTDLKHLFSCNPLRPVYCDGKALRSTRVAPLGWIGFDAGLRSVGHGDEGFAFDNEQPRHRVFVEAFELASRPITNGEFLEFMEDGGYERAELWLSDGWDAVRANGWRAPLYWEPTGDGWAQFTLSGVREFRAEEPVCHVSYYEAEAFARWAGARLPSEVEWEIAASSVSLEGHFLEDGRLHPAPALASAQGLCQMFGDVWEWTGSSYGPYPGYRPPPGPLGEYNGKFMCNQMVLRGGSCASPRSHIRPTYRNFFFPAARWQFSGIRLARDAR